MKTDFLGKPKPPLSKYQCEVLASRIHDIGKATCHSLEEARYLANWIKANDSTMQIVEDKEIGVFYLENKKGASMLSVNETPHNIIN